MFKRLFCWLYSQWLSKAVNEKTDPLVIVLDNLFGSECKYCMAVRAIFFGFGVGLVVAIFHHFFFGVSAFLAALGVTAGVLAWLMTVGERLWLCDAPQKAE